ncbi:MAG: type IV toxin-antitoxin system AbiEi family antitoxin domain-containing protein [Acidimicrobiales bacterium]|nr:type IV toxin-antitoxin system AbiEi family antitoxin domain-containing protein [Acidimicrobiales bacterium]
MREITDLARQAASTHGLLTNQDLERLHYTRAEVRTLVAAGVLTRERRGLYVLAGAPPTWEQQLMRGCLGAAGRGVVSHRSAMRVWDLRPWETALEVTVRGFAAPAVEGVVVHRSWDLSPEDVCEVGGLPVTSVTLTLVDAGSYLRDWEVERAVDAAVGLGLVTNDEIRAHRERVGRHGRSGVTAIDRVLGEAPTSVDAAESPMEIALMRLIDRHGLPAATPQYPVEVAGQRFRIDLAYPEQRVLIEYDGYREHVAPEQFERDRRRQNALVLAGWIVLRFTKSDVRDRPAWVAGEIRRALGSRPPDPR